MSKKNAACIKKIKSTQGECHIEEVFLTTDALFLYREERDEEDTELLHNFFLKDENMIKIIEYSIHKKDKSYSPIEVKEIVFVDKFPFLAHNILRVGGHDMVLYKKIWDEIFKNKRLISRLFSILLENNPNGFYANNFVKLIHNVLKREETKTRMFQHIYKNDFEILKLMVKKINFFPNIENLIIHCVENQDINGIEIEDIEGKKEEFVKHLIISLSDLDKTEMISLLFLAVVNKETNEEPFTTTKYLFKNMSLLIKNTYNIFDHGYEFSKAAKVLKQIISLPVDHPDAIAVIYRNLKMFVEKLQKDDDPPKVKINTGNIVPLGLAKISIIEFFRNAVENYQNWEDMHKVLKLVNFIKNSGMLEEMTNLLFKYPNNDILHSNIAHSICFCLESGNVDLADVLFNRCKIMDKIYNYLKQKSKKKDPKAKKKAHPSLFPHLKKVGFAILEMNRKTLAKFIDTRKKIFKKFERDMKKDHFLQNVVRLGGHIPIPISVVKNLEKKPKKSKEEEVKKAFSLKKKKKKVDEVLEDETFFEDDEFIHEYWITKLGTTEEKDFSFFHE